ncbi:MAG: sensor histidine kinase [Bryobacteraceae bacterium]
MRRRFASIATGLSFVILLILLIWQGSFRISYSPSSASETTLLWSVSTIIFLLTVLVAFMLFRAGVRVYIDRHRNKEGSRIRSKMLFGALALTLAPVLFSVLFSVYVLNRHLDVWFSKTSLQRLNTLYQKEAQERVEAETDWISLLPQTRSAAQSGQVDTALFKKISQEHGIQQLILHRTVGVPILLYQSFDKADSELLHATSDVMDGDQRLGRVSMAAALNGDLSASEGAFAHEVNHQRELQTGRRKFYQDTYFQLICLITLFVLFFAAWSAQVLSRQIAIPISALLGAAHEVRRGNLSYRVRVNAMDELATLVRAFNEMTNELEGSARELEARRRFTEAILESIPTGVISLTTDERIEHVNRALSGIFPGETTARAKLLEDLFSGEELAEVRYLLKRARRTGAAASQFDIQRPNSVLHLAITVASLEEHRGFVLVLEDTSDLLRAQKAAAWQEVARRIAHEIKNPLTPISLSADRIARQISRLPIEPNARAILQECTQTIQQEVGTVKSLVDEFSQFSRFPSAQPVTADLNKIVESAIAVFAGRLDGVALSVELDRSISPVWADQEQIKRVVVNLIDNAAEAMMEAPVRQLFVRTSQPGPEMVELAVIDTGCGISAADKEKLFLPYFSTKGRGTGLGLAIVSHIVTEHHGRVRVEDNYPSGVRFIVELNTAPTEANWNPEIEPTATLNV